ncbi:MAG TPA: copper-binding protein [Phycisphaerales bacterium]|nr:copper-binding protein [Phycisphaerales bacterium]
MSRFLFALLLCVGLAALTACSGKDKPMDPPAEKSTGRTPPGRTPDGTYTVRGEVSSLPTTGDKRTEFRVYHEAIDDFKDKGGKVVGMNAMTMDFPPAKGVDLSNLKKGDKVSLTFSVWWGGSPPWLVTKIEKLPDDTKLVFGKAKPPAEPAKPEEKPVEQTVPSKMDAPAAPVK